VKSEINFSFRNVTEQFNLQVFGRLLSLSAVIRDYNLERNG